ncbi:hypothetical protein L218DRAFT_874200 [Marasmius fiardii PR-910]|nr:hypothetical protein L218DRAFT_874200 [Marasmius fiardii PR-910]
MSFLARSSLRTLRATGRRTVVTAPRPTGPGAEHATVVTDHLPFSYQSKRAFRASLVAFATTAFFIPMTAIYIRW